VTTDAEGRYLKEGLSNGLYIVFPSKPGHTFTANTGNVFQVIDGSNVTKDFTAGNQNYRISGVITDAGGNPVVDVSVTINDNFGFSRTVYTNVNGLYSSPGIADGLYIVWPTKPGYTIAPTQGNVFQSVSGADVTKDFLATSQDYSISGTVLDDNGLPLAGVSVAVNDNFGFSSTTTTDVNGFYKTGGLTDGLYIVFPSKQGYGITANAGNSFQAVSGANVTGKDFTAVPIVKTYSISGFVLENGAPLPGVTVQINDNYGFTSTTTTDNAGFYTQSGIKDGLYIVYPAKPGYQITADTGNIFQTVNGSSIIEKNFSATAQ
jgi:hypothetical protein